MGQGKAGSLTVSEASDLLIRVVHPPTDEDPFLLIDKPRGLPSAPLFEGQESALTQALRLYPAVDAVRGKKSVERGLLHRLDTGAHGLLLIAATQQSYDALSLAQDQGRFSKGYTARCFLLPQKERGMRQGFPPAPFDIAPDALTGVAKKWSVVSAFRHYGKKGFLSRPVTASSGAAAIKKSRPVVYQTDVSLRRLGDEILADCTITKGFKHQVRCHLAWLGFPVKGDELYGSASSGERLEFCASSVCFPHPITGKQVLITL